MRSEDAVPDAPVYTATLEEMQNLEELLAAASELAIQHGAVRIDPPPEWVHPPLRMGGSSRFFVRLQTLPAAPFVDCTPPENPEPESDELEASERVKRHKSPGRRAANLVEDGEDDYMPPAPQRQEDSAQRNEKHGETLAGKADLLGRQNSAELNAEEPGHVINASPRQMGAGGEKALPERPVVLGSRPEVAENTPATAVLTVPSRCNGTGGADVGMQDRSDVMQTQLADTAAGSSAVQSSLDGPAPNHHRRAGDNWEVPSRADPAAVERACAPPSSQPVQALQRQQHQPAVQTSSPAVAVPQRPLSLPAVASRSPLDSPVQNSLAREDRLLAMSVVGPPQDEKMTAELQTPVEAVIPCYENRQARTPCSNPMQAGSMGSLPGHIPTGAQGVMASSGMPAAHMSRESHSGFVHLAPRPPTMLSPQQALQQSQAVRWLEQSSAFQTGSATSPIVEGNRARTTPAPAPNSVAIRNHAPSLAPQGTGLLPLLSPGSSSAAEEQQSLQQVAQISRQEALVCDESVNSPPRRRPFARGPLVSQRNSSLSKAPMSMAADPDTLCGKSTKVVVLSQNEDRPSMIREAREQSSVEDFVTLPNRKNTAVHTLPREGLEFSRSRFESSLGVITSGVGAVTDGMKPILAVVDSPHPQSSLADARPQRVLSPQIPDLPASESPLQHSAPGVQGGVGLTSQDSLPRHSADQEENGRGRGVLPISQTQHGQPRQHSRGSLSAILNHDRTSPSLETEHARAKPVALTPVVVGLALPGQAAAKVDADGACSAALPQEARRTPFSGETRQDIAVSATPVASSAPVAEVSFAKSSSGEVTGMETVQVPVLGAGTGPRSLEGNMMGSLAAIGPELRQQSRECQGATTSTAERPVPVLRHHAESGETRGARCMTMPGSESGRDRQVGSRQDDVLTRAVRAFEPPDGLQVEEGRAQVVVSPRSASGGKFPPSAPNLSQKTTEEVNDLMAKATLAGAKLSKAAESAVPTIHQEIVEVKKDNLNPTEDGVHKGSPDAKEGVEDQIAKTDVQDTARIDEPFPAEGSRPRREVRPRSEKERKPKPSRPRQRRRAAHVSNMHWDQGEDGRLTEPIMFPDSPSPVTLSTYKKKADESQEELRRTLLEDKSLDVAGITRRDGEKSEDWMRNIDVLEEIFWRLLRRGIDGKPLKVSYGVDVEAEGAFDSAGMSYVEWYGTDQKTGRLVKKKRPKKLRSSPENGTEEEDVILDEGNGNDTADLRLLAAERQQSREGCGRTEDVIMDGEENGSDIDDTKDDVLRLNPKGHVGNLNRGGLLRHMPRMPGINHSMYYVGQLFTRFCWHVEDAFLNSVSYLHDGSAEKVWYAIPPQDARMFEEYASHSAFADELVARVGSAQALLMNKTTIFDPRSVRKTGIRVFRVVHKPGSFVLTAPRAYHAGFNSGFNIAEAVNFANPTWFPVGREASRFAREIKKPLCVPWEYLLFHEARAMYIKVSRKKRPRKSSSRLASNALILASELDEVISRGEDRIRQYASKKNCRIAMLSDVDALVKNNQLGPEFGHGAGMVCSVCGHACHFYAEICASCSDSFEARCEQHFGEGHRLCGVAGHKTVLVRRHDPVLLVDVLKSLEKMAGIRRSPTELLARYERYLRSWETPLRSSGLRLRMNLKQAVSRLPPNISGVKSSRESLRQEKRRKHRRKSESRPQEAADSDKEVKRRKRKRSEASAKPPSGKRAGMFTKPVVERKARTPGTQQKKMRVEVYSSEENRMLSNLQRPKQGRSMNDPSQQFMEVKGKGK